MPRHQEKHQFQPPLWKDPTEETETYSGDTIEIEDPYEAENEVNQSRESEGGNKEVSVEMFGAEKNSGEEKVLECAAPAEGGHTNELTTLEGNESEPRMVEATREVEILEEVDETEGRAEMPKSPERSVSPEMPQVNLEPATEEAPDWVIPQCEDREDEGSDDMIIYHRRPRIKRKQMDNQAAIRWAQSLEVPQTEGTSTPVVEARDPSAAYVNEEQMQLKENKRKGKQVMEPARKKRRLVIQDKPSEEDEALRAELRTKKRNDRPRRAYEKRVVNIDRSLLERMLKFGDPTKEKECEERIETKKPALSGKMLH